MPKSYSTDLRKRVIEAVEAGARDGRRLKVFVLMRVRTAEQHRADVARTRRRWIREQGMLDPARLVFIDETAVTTKIVAALGARSARRRADRAPSTSSQDCGAMSSVSRTGLGANWSG